MPSEWGALQVMTGMEMEVLGKLRDVPFVKALAPMERITQRRQQRSHDVLRPLLPGYVLIWWSRDPTMYYHVKAMPGVIRWLGDTQPQTIPEEQMRVLLLIARHCESGKPAQTIQINGKTVIACGPLKALNADIIRVNRRAGRAALKVRIGNETRTVMVTVDNKPRNDGG